MLAERDLLETIEECKAVKRPTAATCQLMASCYTILDHMFPEYSRSADVSPVSLYSSAPAPQNDEISGSEFAIAANLAGMKRLLEVMDEHMECIQLIYPKEYAAPAERLFLSVRPLWRLQTPVSGLGRGTAFRCIPFPAGSRAACVRFPQISLRRSASTRF